VGLLWFAFGFNPSAPAAHIFHPAKVLGVL